jgi:hypothetical protein
MVRVLAVNVPVPSVAYEEVSFTVNFVQSPVWVTENAVIKGI